MFYFNLKNAIHLDQIFSIGFNIIYTLFQEKIHDLERKTESQTAKYEEILHQLDSLKTRQQHRSLPTSTGNSPSINNSHHSPLSITIDSQASLTDDSAPVSPRQRSKGLNETSARIAMARYSYEPLRFSPNEHPEVELPLKLGEYYIIYGNTDEVNIDILNVKS